MKKETFLKGILKWTALLLMIFSLTIPAAGKECQANAGEGTYEIASGVGYLVLRTEPKKESKNIIAYLYNGENVEVINKTNKTYWYVYSSNLGLSGYVNKNYLLPVAANGSATAKEEMNSYWSVKVDKGYLALRTEKKYDEKNEIGELYTDDLVEVMDASDSQYWYVYSPKHGMSGYVNKDYLYLNISDDICVVKVDKGYLALRTAKAYDEKNEIGELYTGDVVQIKKADNSKYWYVYSPKHDMEGYVNKNYLYGSNGEAVTTITKVVHVSKGYLALRTEKKYDERNEIGELYTDDIVQVKDSSDSKYWYVYSPKHGLSGYVDKDYLY